MTRGNAQDTAQCMTHRFNEGLEDRGRQRCGRNHGLLPSPLLFPHMEGRRAVPHGRGSSTHKKTPTCYGRGRHTYAAAPFPRKDVSALCRAGLLARGISLLSAPSRGRTPQWSLQISFRLQLRGSDGFAPSSLVTRAACDQPYERYMQFCQGAYGSPRGFVKVGAEVSRRERQALVVFSMRCVVHARSASSLRPGENNPLNHTKRHELPVSPPYCDLSTAPRRVQPRPPARPRRSAKVGARACARPVSRCPA